METTINIKGIYDNGIVTLTETPPAALVNQQVEVVVAFKNQVNNVEQNQPVFGFSKGTVTYIAPDFDEPLDDLKDYF
jgi:hypothetical protein